MAFTRVSRVVIIPSDLQRAEIRATGITQIFDRAEIETYLDTVHRVGALGHVSSDEAYEEMREAGAFDEDPVAWAEEILLIERVKSNAPLRASGPSSRGRRGASLSMGAFGVNPSVDDGARRVVLPMYPVCIP